MICTDLFLLGRSERATSTYVEEPPDSKKKDVDASPPHENVALGTETTRPISRDNDAMKVMVTLLS